LDLRTLFADQVVAFWERLNFTNSISRNRPDNYATIDRVGLLDEGVDRHFRTDELRIFSCAASIDQYHRLMDSSPQFWLNRVLRIARVLCMKILWPDTGSWKTTPLLETAACSQVLRPTDSISHYCRRADFSLRIRSTS